MKRSGGGGGGGGGVARDYYFIESKVVYSHRDTTGARE
jgi:hypothetical protein